MLGNSSSIKLDNATLSLFQNADTSIAISIIYMIITAVNLAGNGLSMWILLFHTAPMTASIIFMINLTLSDLSLGIALPFQIAYQLQGYHWKLGPKMCSLLTLIFYSNMYCSILTMMAIGIDRYLGIVRPMLFRQRNNKSIAAISISVMWGLVLSILYPLMTTDLTYDISELGITTCFDVLKLNMLPSVSAWAGFLFSLVFLLFLFPFCVTTFCYVRVICKLSSDCRTAQKARAIRLAFIVLLVFVLCFAPNNILLLTHSVLRLFYEKSVYMAYKLTLCFSCLNSCLDPFIYYFASKDFRQKMRQIMNLHSLSSADSIKWEHKESFYSANCPCKRQETANSKMYLMPESPQHQEMEYDEQQKEPESHESNTM